MNVIGLIAGNGSFPALVLRAARRTGRDVVMVAIEGEASRELDALAAEVGGTSITWIQLGQLGACIKALKWWEEVGVDRMVFLINTGETIPQEKVLNSLRLFATDVMPAFTRRERAEASRAAEAGRREMAQRAAAGAG